MEGLVIKLAETEEERQAVFALRTRVFVQEQGVPLEDELDEDDEAALHVAAIFRGTIVGTGRVLYSGSREARIGRMAVEEPWRRRGIGGQVLETLEQATRQQGTEQCVLHAQTYVKSFYGSHGYGEEGDAFLEAGIEHVQMRKRL